MGKDMYGHEIYPLGDTGWGVSVTFSESVSGLLPEFAVFTKEPGSDAHHYVATGDWEFVFMTHPPEGKGLRQ